MGLILISKEIYSIKNEKPKREIFRKRNLCTEEEIFRKRFFGKEKKLSSKKNVWQNIFFLNYALRKKTYSEKRLSE